MNYFDEIMRLKRCKKSVHLEDLALFFKMKIYLQQMAWIKPRTKRPNFLKFGGFL